MEHFFTTEVGEIPVITPFWYVVMMASIVGCILLSIHFYEKPLFVKFFQGAQIFQLVALYVWYFGNAIPLSNSLPLYHCRLSMFAVLFLKDRNPLKQYFALLGVSGAIFAIGYPVFDPYTWPHITGFSFIVGHYALLVNSLVYLLRAYDQTLLSKKTIIVYTLVMNAILAIVNHMTQGNYGLLRFTPFISHTPLIVRYIAVSLVLMIAIVIIDIIFAKTKRRSQALLLSEEIPAVAVRKADGDR